MMKKEILLALFVVGLSNFLLVADSLFKLPVERIIKERLDKNGYSSHNEQMKLSEKFADKEMSFDQIELAVSDALAQFCGEQCDNDICCPFTRTMTVKDISSILLQDYQKELKKHDQADKALDRKS